MSEVLPARDISKERLLFADVTRAVAILMVILLHASALYFYQEGTPLRKCFLSSRISLKNDQIQANLPD